MWTSVILGVETEDRRTERERRRKGGEGEAKD